MHINGYKVHDLKLVVDGRGKLVEADRPCEICLGSKAKVVKVLLRKRTWIRVRLCEKCLIDGGMFLDVEDLAEEIAQISGDRGRG
jgi:hypothetical protein